MKSMLGVCLIAIAVTSTVAAQNPSVPALRPGIHVQLPVSNLAVAMPEADQDDVTVVTITAGGQLYVGAEPIKQDALSSLRAPTVYVKADARASYQEVLKVLSALQGHRLILLTEAMANATPGGITPPYGVSAAVGRP
jgi:biopolymer transport protein ExbD